MAVRTSLAAKLALIAERAPELRRAGVTHLEIDGIAMDLAPHNPLTVDDFKADAPQQSSDPLYDSSTYAGGQVPGYTFEREPEGDAS